MALFVEMNRFHLAVLEPEEFFGAGCGCAAKQNALAVMLAHELVKDASQFHGAPPQSFNALAFTSSRLRTWAALSFSPTVSFLPIFSAMVETGVCLKNLLSIVGTSSFAISFPAR